MAIERIVSATAPAAVGPYSLGVRAGDFFFFSGQIPLEPETGLIVAGGIEAQAERVMANMAAALQGAGLGFANVVKTTIYLTELKHFTVVNEIYGRYFEGVFPARATLQVAALPKGAEIEIEWVAYGGTR